MKSYELTPEEVSYLWKKLEFKKKKNAESNKNQLYTILNSGKTVFTEEEYSLVFRSLESSFKKNLKNGKSKTELGKSISGKLPEAFKS